MEETPGLAPPRFEPPIMTPDGTAPLPPTPWGFWATIGWTALIALLYLISQGFVVLVYCLVMAATTHQLPKSTDIETDGLLISVATISTAPVPIILSILFARIRRGIRVGDYLGFHWPRPRTILFWCVATLAITTSYDVMTNLLGQPSVPEVMIETYRRAVFVPLLWVAVVIGAPLSEEFLFRGFFFKGLQHSPLGPVGAVLITAASWASIHLQYDLWGIGAIFLLGLVLGFVRWKTGSLLLCVLLHALNNLIASIEVALHAS